MPVAYAGRDGHKALRYRSLGNRLQFRPNARERIEYEYRPQTGTLDDLGVAVGESLRFRPAAGGGPTFAPAGDELPQGELLDAKVEDNAVVAVWRYRLGDQTADVTWRLAIQGESLILTVDEPTGTLSAWRLGEPDSDSVEEIAVPYLTNHCGAGPVYLVDKGPFVFRQPDWYVTHASIFTPEACEYVPLLNGKRNSLHERIFLTVSSDFHEVLPNIPNPKSPMAHVLGENVYVNMSGSLEGDALDRCLALWRERKRQGMGKLIVKHHAHTFSSHSGQGNEPFVQRVKAAGNIPGGEAALARYIDDVKGLGMQ